MKERGDVQNRISTAGKGVEILEMTFGGNFIPLTPKCISIF